VSACEAARDERKDAGRKFQPRTTRFGCGARDAGDVAAALCARTAACTGRSAPRRGRDRSRPRLPRPPHCEITPRKRRTCVFPQFYRLQLLKPCEFANAACLRRRGGRRRKLSPKGGGDETKGGHPLRENTARWLPFLFEILPAFLHSLLTY
jgi:hypothetical protein